jgi:hypothetical protein
MKEIIIYGNNCRNNKYKYKFIRTICNDENRLYYTSLSIFNLVSFDIINKDDMNVDKYYNSYMTELEELYYMSEINVDNFAKYHYSILISELPQIFKDASCIKLKLSNIENIDILLGIDGDNDDVIYQPLYYIFKDDLRTWLELIYYTNKLLNKYLVLNNLIINVNFFTLYKFDTIIENGITVIVPIFDEYII